MPEDLLKNEQFIRLSALVSAMITNLRLKGLIDQEEIMKMANILAKDTIERINLK